MRKQEPHAAEPAGRHHPRDPRQPSVATTAAAPQAQPDGMASIPVLPIAFWTTDNQLRITSGTGGALDALFQRGSGQLRGMLVRDCFSGDDPDHPAIEAHERARAGETVQCTVARSGAIFDCCVEPLRDETGKIFGTRGMALEVSRQRVQPQSSASASAERERAHKELQFSEQRFRSMVQNSSDVITIFQADGVIRYESPSVERVMGYKPAELVGRSAFEYVHPDDVERVTNSFQRFLQGATSTNIIEYRYRHKNGSWRVLESTASNMLQDGSIAGIVSNSRDVTERRAAEDALQMSEQRFRSLVQNSSDVFTIVNADGTIRYSSPAIKNLLGYEQGEQKDRPIFGLVHPDDRAKVEEAFANVLQDKDSVQVAMFRALHKNGTWRLLETRGRNLLNDPAVGGIVLNSLDVTEQYSSEEALRRSEERYRLLFQRNLAGVYWTSAEGELVDCNESFAHMFGYRSRSEVMLSRSLDFYEHVADQEMLLAELQERKTLTNVESLCRRRDGKTFWVLQNISLIQDASGATMIQGTVIDITERKFAEQNLRQAEGKFRSIFENAAEGIFQTTLDGRWIIANPKLAQILGYSSAKELMSDVDLGRHYYAESNRRREFIRLLETQGAINGFESQALRKDGEIIWISESARCVRDEYGHLVGFEGTVQDVTERKNAEDALRQSERRLRKQNEMLLDLSQRKIIASGDLGDALREITEAAAETLETEIASVWLLNEDRTLLRCMTAYHRSSNSHTEGTEYVVAEFPCYFQTLELERTIDADDALSDPRTVEFSAMLKREGVNSVLDSVIRVGGEVVGVLSHQHTGPPRLWTLDEKNFAGSVADLLSLAIEADQRQRAQEALRESESKFRAVAETASSAIYIHNGRQFLFCNHASEVISGYSRQELMEMDPFSMAHPDDRALLQQRFEARFDGGETPARYEYRIIDKQGNVRWVDFSASMISFAGQNALLGTAFDITERKRAEQLQSALYRIAEKTSTAPDLDEFFAAIHAILSELVYARNFYIALYDPRTQLLNFPYYVDEHDEPPAPEPLGKGLTDYVLRTGVPYLNTPEQELELSRRGEVELIGSPCVDWLGVPLKSGDQTFGVLALQSYTEQERFGDREKEILTFVSQSVATAILRKRDEDALRQSEARYRSQVQSAVYGIFRATIAGRFLDVNPALVNMLGYASAEEVLALNMAFDVFADAMQHARMQEEVRRSEQITGIDVSWKRKDGHAITVRLSGRVLRNQRSEAEGLEMLAEDITERFALEDQLRQSQKMEAVGRLAGGVAHDFNNLLTVIKGYSELMLDQVREGDPLRSEADEIKKAADRAAGLTRQLLAFSRKQVLAPQVLDLNTVVGNMEKLLRRLIGEDVHLATELEHELGRAKADPGQTEQVIMNLAVNARDAMPQGGRLVISTSNAQVDEASLPQSGLTPGEYICLKVSDTGTGMDAETQKRIFEPFYTTKEQGKGTGLGLSTVYGIVKQSGGYVAVESELGKGTTFSVYLPRVVQAERAQEVKPVAVKQLRGTETILLVEDEDGVRNLARQILQKQGYTVIDTRHGGEALLVCERNRAPIHLLLTDVILAQMSGRELAERLCTMRPDMKVLYMSGYSGDAVSQHGILNLGATFLQKPFSTEALVAKVREVLDTPRTKSAAQ